MKRFREDEETERERKKEKDEKKKERKRVKRKTEKKINTTLVNGTRIALTCVTESN